MDLKTQREFKKMLDQFHKSTKSMELDFKNLQKLVTDINSSLITHNKNQLALLKSIEQKVKK